MRVGNGSFSKHHADSLTERNLFTYSLELLLLAVRFVYNLHLPCTGSWRGNNVAVAVVVVIVVAKGLAVKDDDM